MSRPFGSLRVLASGRVQARYWGPDGLRHSAPFTFDNKRQARRWLATVETDIARGSWDNAVDDGEPLGPYAVRWIDERAGLSEQTARLYRSLLRNHIEPKFGQTGLRKITPGMVRSWRKDLIEAGVGASTVAKAYRLLRAVLNTAMDDELIRRNPCRIKGAAVEHPAERPILELHQVMTLAAAIEPRYRLLVLLAVFASLRWGELMGLRRTDFDLAAGTVKIERSVAQLGARQVLKKPKTAAGVRTVAFPMWLVPEIEKHLSTYGELGGEERVFVGPLGATPYRGNFHRGVWLPALKAAGLTGIHFHDLRHTGNQLAAMTGASTKELMARMGHASVHAALIYQHRTEARDRVIANSLDRMLEALDGSSGHAGGTESG